MHALVVAGGELLLSRRVRAVAAAADLVVAADSGLRHLDALGVAARVVVGDYDSQARPEATVEREVIVHPVAKDDTDLALALREAVARGATRVTLLSALRGPRLDHGVANLLLLAADEFSAIDLRAVDGDDELRAVRSSAPIAGAAGDLVSLLALSERCEGVRTQGLAWPLRGETLERGSTRGVSNVLEAEHAGVALSSGVLLLIHRDGGDPNLL